MYESLFGRWKSGLYPNLKTRRDVNDYLIPFFYFPDEPTKDGLLFIVIERLLGAHSLPSFAVIADKTLTKTVCS